MAQMVRRGSPRIAAKPAAAATAADDAADAAELPGVGEMVHVKPPLTETQLQQVETVANQTVSRFRDEDELTYNKKVLGVRVQFDKEGSADLSTINVSTDGEHVAAQEVEATAEAMRAAIAESARRLVPFGDDPVAVVELRGGGFVVDGIIDRVLLAVDEGTLWHRVADDEEEGAGAAAAAVDIDAVVLDQVARAEPSHAVTLTALHAVQKTSQEQKARGEWTAVSWVESVGIASAVALALLHDRAGSEQSEVDALQKLGDHSVSDLTGVLRNGGLVESVAALLQPALHKLAHAEAVTTAQAQSKFAGQVEMSFGGLDAFYGGLEAQIGPPQPQVFAGMEAEHLRGADAVAEWTTANYGLATTAAAEWRFVVEAAATKVEESTELLPDRSRCRQPVPLHVFEKAAEPKNEALRRAKQPELTTDEIIGARLYTGPLFEKYNAVMRGLNGGVPFLRRQLVRLCAQPGTLAVYDDACNAGVADAFSTALATTNTYITTLHVINSSIVKIGRLTTACRVYRGYSGMALPPEFWAPNEYGVVGGVESAFMSCSAERDVAMTYAGSRGGMGIVFEVAQGMVDRGASIEWLSQYPHEREILFGPLTGLEVMGTRIEGSVVVLEVRLSVNLSALTIEQVVSKRRKLLLDMARGMRVEVRDRLTRQAIAKHHFAEGSVTPITCRLSTAVAQVGALVWHARHGVGTVASARGGVVQVDFRDRSTHRYSPRSYHKLKRIDPATADAPTPTVIDGTIVGTRYVASGYGSVCEAAYEALPKGASSGTRASSTYRPQQDDFEAVPPWSVEEAELRASLAEAMVRDLAMSREPAWYNDDVNFSAAVSQALSVKRALSLSPVTIDLSGVSMLADLPESIGGCTALRQLSLYGCTGLSGVPASLRACTELLHLDLAGVGSASGVGSVSGVRELCAALPRLLVQALEAPTISLPAGMSFNLFPSHVWATGQDQVASLKQKLVEALPGVRMFRDVDDLADVADLEAHIDESVNFVLFVSRGFFKSKNCMSEVKHAVTNKRQMIVLRETDPTKGGFARWPADAMAELEEMCAASDGTYDYEELQQCVFSSPVVDWERIPALQANTLVAIAQHLLSTMPAYSSEPGLLPLQYGGQLLPESLFFSSRKPVYASPNNPGALAFAREISAVYPQVVAVDAPDEGGRREEVAFLLYLNDATFVGDPGRLLAEEVLAALGAKQKILMAHERDATTGRGGCEFGQFFDVTPNEVIEAGLYKILATYLPAAEAFRPTAIAQLAREAGASTHPQSVFARDAQRLWIKRDPLTRA